jgi:hypothetical protein
MRSLRLLAPLAFVSAAALPGTPSASAPPETRLIIRGTGTDISVERNGPPAPGNGPELSRRAEPSILDEAVRMKERGTSDEALLWYLRAHAGRLPIVVDLDTVRRLRAAGTGSGVMAYLASVSALEIGDSGAVGGGPAAETPARESEPETGYAAQYGPVFGGYSASARSGRPGLYLYRGGRLTHLPMSTAPAPRATPDRPPGELRRFIFGSR